MKKLNAKFIIFSILLTTALAHGMNPYFRDNATPEEKEKMERLVSLRRLYTHGRTLQNISHAIHRLEVTVSNRHLGHTARPKPSVEEHYKPSEKPNAQRQLFLSDSSVPPLNLTDLATHPEVKTSARNKGKKRFANDDAPPAKKAKKESSPIKTDNQSLAILAETLDAAVAEQILDYEKGLEAGTLAIGPDKDHPESILAALDEKLTDKELAAKEKKSIPKRYNILPAIYQDLCKHNKFREQRELEPISFNEETTRYYYSSIHNNTWAPFAHGQSEPPFTLDTL